MSFVSPEFALLALLFFPLYWALHGQPLWQRRFLTVSGYALYASWSLPFAGMLLAYALGIWGLGRWIAAARPAAALAPAPGADPPPGPAAPVHPIPPPTRHRLALGTGLTLCVLFLVLVKYYEFLRASLADALAPLGWALPLPILDVVAPVGVSFFTFQAITYLVSMARAGARPRRAEEVLLFLGFWPTLFAGPILRAESFFAQLDAGTPGQPLHPWRALYLILLGVAQKMVLASWLAATFVEPVFRYPEQYGGLGATAGVLAYTLQIFLDFGGYTLLVTGLGLLLGFELPLNFHHPYLARNLQAFWQRWHVSLSSFIRDYIYIPLGGSHAGFWRTQRNVVLAMLISGAWHGASWTFIVWGALHGLGMVAFNLARERRMPPLPGWLAQTLTLAFVALAWLFFRAESLEAAWELARLGSGWAGWRDTAGLPVHELVLLTLLFLWLSRHAAQIEAWAVARLSRLSLPRAAAVLAGLAWLVIALGPDGVPSFIYYRF